LVVVLGVTALLGPLGHVALHRGVDCGLLVQADSPVKEGREWF